MISIYLLNPSHQFLKWADEFTFLLYFFYVNSPLVFYELVLGYLLARLVEVPKLFLLYFFVVFLFNPLIRGEKVVMSKVGMPDLINDVHAGVIDEWDKLGFKKIEVIEYGLL